MPLQYNSNFAPQKFRNYFQTDEMFDKKSFLNPNASPYIPICKSSSSTNGMKQTKRTFDDSNSSEDRLRRLENHEGNPKLKEDCGRQRLEDLDLSPESFSNLVISENFEDIFHADICAPPDQPNLIIESLGLMFPNTSMECIEEVLKLNHFDLGLTLSMLDELEDNDFEDASSQHDSSK